MTNPRWEVESFFDGFGGCFVWSTVSWISIQAEDVVKHVLVLYGCRLCGTSIRFCSLRMKLIFDFLGMADWWCSNSGFLAVFFVKLEGAPAVFGVDRSQNSMIHLSKQDMTDLLTVTLNNMYFSFNGQVFCRKEGLPMGSSKNVTNILTSTVSH